VSGERNALFFVPVGYGYTAESDLLVLTNATTTWPTGSVYSGLAPMNWGWYLKYQDSVLSNHMWYGCWWTNPATSSFPDGGVIQELQLEEGQCYRMLFFYNHEDGYGPLLSKTVVATNLVGPMGDSQAMPIEITMYLGPQDVSRNLVSHFNESIVFFDNDGDGLGDGSEIVWGTHALNGDSDKDRLCDGEEIKEYHTHPLKKDTDGDLFWDGTEIECGFNPTNGLNYPKSGPAWWYNQGVMHCHASNINDFSVANAGQLKWIAKQACQTFEAGLLGGGGEQYCCSGFRFCELQQLQHSESGPTQNDCSAVL